MTAEPALVVDRVSAAYGRIEVLRDVSFAVPPRTIFALLGANGAGKSTCLRVISGFLGPSSGSVVIDGVDTGELAAEKIAREHGCCCIPEGRGIFPNLTVAENLRMWGFGARIPRREVEEIVFSRFPLLGERRRQLAGSLSGGEQQILALSRALSTKPRLLLIDELSMGIAPKAVASLYEVIVGLVEQEGLTVVLVEQFAQAALRVAQNAAVLVRGEIAAAGSSDEVSHTLGDLYLASKREPVHQS